MPPPFNPASIDAYMTVNQGIHVVRPTAIVPASGASQNLFLSSGPVFLAGLMGRVTAAADVNAELIAAYIGVSGTTNIAAVSTTVATCVIGSQLYITGVFATGLQIVVGTIPVSQATFRPGTLINSIIWPSALNLGIVGSVASNLTLSVEWHCWYMPMFAATGTVVAV